MLLQSSEGNRGEEAVNEMKVLPSSRVISALGTATNGFLFSTTPIILRILQSLCSNVVQEGGSED